MIINIRVPRYLFNSSQTSRRKPVPSKISSRYQYHVHQTDRRLYFTVFIALTFTSALENDPFTLESLSSLPRILVNGFLLIRHTARNVLFIVMTLTDTMGSIPYSDHVGAAVSVIQQALRSITYTLGTFYYTLSVLEVTLGNMIDPVVAQCVVYLIYAAAILTIYNFLRTVFGIFCFFWNIVIYLILEPARVTRSVYTHTFRRYFET